MNNHKAGFRPSKFPALEKCVHYVSKEGGDTEARERGTNIHVEIAKLHKFIAVMGPEPRFENAGPEFQWAADLVLGYLRDGWHIHAVETPVNLLDEFGDTITEGCVDLVLERDREFLIVDWKTGDRGDYSAQMAGYIMAWWDMHPEAKTVHCLIGYVDLRETFNCNQAYSMASERVANLYARWSDKPDERHINPFCDWCALRPECPAWRAEASSALTEISQLALNDAGLPDGESLVTAKVDLLKNNPTLLEEFMIAWERAKTLVDDDWSLKEALKTHMTLGYKAEHYALVTVKDKQEVTRSVDPEEFLQKVVNEIGTMCAAPAIKVDPDRAIEVWTNYLGDKKPFPVEIKETVTDKPGYQYIKRKGKPGAGEARKKRKELE